MNGEPQDANDAPAGSALALDAGESGLGAHMPSTLPAMSSEIHRRTVTVQDPMGLHMRPLTAFAQLANQVRSTVTVIKDGQRVNGKSPLELMLLAAQQGTELILEVSGDDGAAAIDRLAALLAAPVPEEGPAAANSPPS